MHLLYLTLLMTAASPAFQVETLDGRTLTGAIVELSAEKIAIGAADGKVSLAVADVLAITPSRAKSGDSPAVAKTAAKQGVVVELSDGSVIYAKEYTATEKQAKLAMLDGTAAEIPAGSIRTVRMNLRADTAALAEWKRLAATGEQADLLVVDGRAAIDYHKGVIQSVTADAVRFDLDGDPLLVKRSKVFGLIYRHNETSAQSGAIGRMTDVSGSVWQVATVSLDGDRLRAATPAGLSAVLPLSQVAKIEFASGKQVFLSDWKPDSTEWTPYFSSTTPLPAARDYFAPRTDRGFNPGSPLQLDGTTYRKGLAIRCRTELTYRLPEAFSRFRATVGVAGDVAGTAVRKGEPSSADVANGANAKSNPAKDDAAKTGAAKNGAAKNNVAKSEAVKSGGVRLTLRGDGRVLYQGEFCADEAARPIDCDLSGVKRLTIVVDFGDTFGTVNGLLLCNARLTK